MDDYQIRYDMSSTSLDGLIDIAMTETVRGHVERAAHWQVNTRNHLIREELIKLGWTPPVLKDATCATE